MTGQIEHIGIERIFPHPENPRADVGDVTELAESIKERGIMQNLTVIPWEDVYSSKAAPAADAMVVVIGHRRLAAAKQAGLATLPCAVTRMDRKTQVSTMLLENMQRADLTIPEQAHGFQLMMDLGATVQEISEKTGFAERTVQRRLQIAKLNTKLLEKSWEAGGCTLEQYAQIASLENKKAQDEVLKAVGSNDFKWRLNHALKEQKEKKNEKILLKALKGAGLKKYDGKEYNPLYSDAWSQVHRFVLGEDDLLENYSFPKNTEGIFWFNDGYGRVYLIKKAKRQKRETPKISEKEKAANEQRRVLLKKSREMLESRQAFVAEYAPLQKDEELAYRWLLHYALKSKMLYTRLNEKPLRAAAGTPPQGVDRTKHVLSWAWTAAKAPFLAAYALAGDGETDSEMLKPYRPGYCEQMPTYEKNSELEEIYEFLQQFGYVVSSEELQMLDGTHPLYGKMKEGKNDAAEES